MILSELSYVAGSNSWKGLRYQEEWKFEMGAGTDLPNNVIVEVQQKHR